MSSVEFSPVSADLAADIDIRLKREGHVTEFTPDFDE